MTLVEYSGLIVAVKKPHTCPPYVPKKPGTMCPMAASAFETGCASDTNCAGTTKCCGTTCFGDQCASGRCHRLLYYDSANSANSRQENLANSANSANSENSQNLKTRRTRRIRRTPAKSVNSVNSAKSTKFNLESILLVV